MTTIETRPRRPADGPPHARRTVTGLRLLRAGVLCACGAPAEVVSGQDGGIRCRGCADQARQTRLAREER